MSSKIILVLCAQALFVQPHRSHLSHCGGRSNLDAGQPSYDWSATINPGLGNSACASPIVQAPSCSGSAYNGNSYGNAGLGLSGLGIKVIPTSGGSLPVSSYSTISPNGLSVISENTIDGNFYVNGELPFLSAVALEGVLPSSGAGAVSYSCGNGVTAIESIAPAGAYGGAGAYGAASASGLTAGYGLGAGAIAPGAGIGALSSGLGCNAAVQTSALSQNCGRTSFSPPAYTLSTPYGYDGFSTSFASNTFPSRLASNSLTYNGLSNNIINALPVEITPTSGGALPVTSASPIAPNSIVVASENVYEGTLAVAGELPFVGTVGMEGDLPTIGSGAVNHACGNGAIGMISQDALVNNIGTGYAASAFGNMYGNIGGFSNPAGAYPANGYASGLASGALGSTYNGLAYPGAAGYGSGVAAYGGAGEGNVAVAGELPVAGTTALYGQVPIMGSVSFGGAVAAAGSVTITGKCGCGRGYQYLY
nr:fibroin heavy chain [Helicoverpa armigera]